MDDYRVNQDLGIQSKIPGDGLLLARWAFAFTFSPSHESAHPKSLRKAIYVAGRPNSPAEHNNRTYFALWPQEPRATSPVLRW
jgi:hypothetical protein